MIKEICKIRAIDFIDSDNKLCEITFKTNDMGKMAKCGQFVHILCGADTYLRRPISICDVIAKTMVIDGKKTYVSADIRIVFEVKGDGTKWLSKLKVDDEIDVLGPCGNGFNLDKMGEYPVFIGGGIGVPPMLMCVKNAAKLAVKPTAILGFRSEKQVILEDDFVVANTYITTDDGSYSQKGFVTDVLKELVEQGKVTSVYACGPRPMLKGIASVSGDIFTEVSMEELMGCGIGACLVCACKVKANDKDFDLKHVCKDGPVFNAKEVIL